MCLYGIPLTASFSAYTETMIEIESAKVKSKAEADKYLQKVEPVRVSNLAAIVY